ncbi:hypothetical protein E4631_09225 [Hymenobacter sp. UV11]|uniref:M1 family aminopeptidase n=1 Tax=Hymenobacter sp. UV11 TaxID=1849735 RepID=UPI00105B7903|nr:M1 family aminopeptidase [Hymenobacter sp. UV11]TFZ67122.1 hypothetical protein E4631_09225 [Hymenobacter sp. UV11]
MALLWFFCGGWGSSFATPTVQVRLQVAPATHSFACEYTFSLPATDTASVVRLNLNRQFSIQHLTSSQAIRQRVVRRYYPYFADTMQQVEVRFLAHLRRARQLTFTYSGTLDKNLRTAQVMEFSGHSNWLPFRPLLEYEVIAYSLVVSVPPAYQVRSATPGQHEHGQWTFRGTGSAVEITALVAPQFQQVASAKGPRILVIKAAPPLLARDTLLLHKAEDIIAFYNRSLGAQDPITRFSVLLPGTNRDAFGLLDNATVITYSDFDVSKKDELLILAHEISHKWWGYGSVHDETEWLNEAFATYASLLYLRASGDSAGYRTELAKRVKSAAGAPAISGFDREQAPYPLFRRVIYDKGTVVLAALHARVGTEKMCAILAKTAAEKVSTTAGFLAVVAQVSGPATRQWLGAELRH